MILGKLVTTEFAASEPRGTRNPWDRERTPGGSSSGSAAAVACGMVPAALGTQVVGSILRPASFCGCVGFKPSVGRINRGGSYDYFSQSCTGVLAASLEDAWLVAVGIAARVGGDPGYPGLQGPAEPPPPRRPRTLAVLQTSGWEEAAPEARAAFAAAAARLAAAGIALADRHADPVIEEVEGAIADSAPLTRTINAWEGRWPLNTYRDRDATKLSRSALERLAMAEAMTLTEYGAAITVRQRNRETHARLAARYDAAITLAAPGSRSGRARLDRQPGLQRACFHARYSCRVAAAALDRRACRSGCRSPVLSVRTPRCSRWRPRSAICCAQRLRFPQFSSEASMRFGWLTLSLSPSPEEDADRIDQQIEQVRFAERLGFGDVWLTEHYFTGESVSPTATASSLGNGSGKRAALKLMDLASLSSWQVDFS